MRPGRPEDLPAVLELSRHEIRIGRQDTTPDEMRLRRFLARFDWDSRSRIEDRGGAVTGSVLVMSRQTPDGTLAFVYAAGVDDTFAQMVRWGVQFSRAAGAAIVQMRVARGFGEPLAAAGLRAVRPWWRMDRGLEDGMPAIVAVQGYELIDGTTAAPGSWGEAFNRSFADHWRYIPQAEEELLSGKDRELCLMALTPAGTPAAITLCEIESDPMDGRPRPVGQVSSVGTVPQHRRRGLAGWLVAESLRRLRAGGARLASLYVDGLNHTRAGDVYRKLGFEVVHQAEVWEATFR
jgi:ribosomal protein S18 acetylase RimI-like enzyme